MLASTRCNGPLTPRTPRAPATTGRESAAPRGARRHAGRSRRRAGHRGPPGPEPSERQGRAQPHPPDRIDRAAPSASRSMTGRQCAPGPHRLGPDLPGRIGREAARSAATDSECGGIPPARGRPGRAPPDCGDRRVPSSARAGRRRPAVPRIRPCAAGPVRKYGEALDQQRHDHRVRGRSTEA